MSLKSPIFVDRNASLKVTTASKDPFSPRWLSFGGRTPLPIPLGVAVHQPNKTYALNAEASLLLVVVPYMGGRRGTLVLSWLHGNAKEEATIALDSLRQMPGLAEGAEAALAAEGIVVRSLWSHTGVHKNTSISLTKPTIRTLSGIVGHPSSDGAWVFSALSEGRRAATLRRSYTPGEPPKLTLWIPT